MTAVTNGESSHRRAKYESRAADKHYALTSSSVLVATVWEMMRKKIPCTGNHVWLVVQGSFQGRIVKDPVGKQGPGTARYNAPEITPDARVL